MNYRTLLVHGCLAAALAAGCSRPMSTTTAPAVAALGVDGAIPAPVEAGAFYPLALGSQWDYAGSFQVQIVPTTGAPSETVVVPSTRHVELICLENRSSGDYVVEHTHLVESGPFGGHEFDFWVHYRQDASGLYEADVAEPPSCVGEAGRPVSAARRSSGAVIARAVAQAGAAHRPAFEAAAATLNRKLEALSRLLRSAGTTIAAAEPRPGEITRLAYPLRPGASWLIRDDPPFVATVEAAESLTLPAGRFTSWRVRIDTEFLGPEDSVHFWYSRQGTLKMFAHFTGVATDETGNPIGTLIAEQRLDLTGLDLAGRGRF